MKPGTQIFHAKVNKGTKQNPQWEFQGTVVIRPGGSGGVLFLQTGEIDENDKPVALEVALFPKRGKGAGAEPKKPASP